MFSIIHPGLFAAGLACIAIPIIIHLLRRKRKPISWGAMRFLEQAYRKRKRILTIEQLILLVMRCALVVLLAAGIGGLMLGSSVQSNAPTALTIVLDNAIGSALTADTGDSALDQSKRAALDALDQLNPARGDRAALITLGGPSNALVLHPSTDIDAVRAQVDATQPTDSAADFPGMIELLNAQDPPQENTRESLFIASPFRGGTLDIAPDTQTRRFSTVIATSPRTNPVANVGIDSITPSRSLRLSDTHTPLPISIGITLIRSPALAETTSNITVTDASTGQTIASAAHRWGAGETQAALAFTIRADKLTTIRAGSAAIIATIDPDANPRDNAAACVVRLRRSLRVAVIEADTGAQPIQSIRPARALRAALAPNEASPIEMVMLDQARLTPAQLASFDALWILTPNTLPDDSWNALSIANHAGLVVLITPGALAPAAQWTNALSTLGVDAPETLVPRTHKPPITLADHLPDHPTLSALQSEYSALSRTVRVSRTIDLSAFPQAHPIATLDNGSALIASIKIPNRGAIILTAAALDLQWSDLPARPLFVPMMQELVRQSIGRSQSREPILAGHTPSDINELSPVSLNHPVFGARVPSTGSLRNAGLYAQLDENGAAQSIIPVNPNAPGADTTPGDQAALSNQLTRLFNIETIDWSSSTDPQNDAKPSTPQASTLDRFAIAGWIFLIGAILGILELVLARVFSFREEAIQAGSSA